MLPLIAASSIARYYGREFARRTAKPLDLVSLRSQDFCEGQGQETAADPGIYIPLSDE